MLSCHTGPDMFAPHQSNGMGGPPNAYHIPPTYHQQPAPRQRTAIACRYCRRRKIRCSGFETSSDGRCANCMRFNQECVFTPVSSQTGPIQAFIPAPQSAIGRNGSPVLYGPHGTPLPPNYGQNQLHDGGRLLPPLSNEPRGYHSGNGCDPDSWHADEHSTHFGRRNSDDFQRHYSNQPPSPSSHLPTPSGHDASRGPSAPYGWQQGGTQPSSLPPGSYYPPPPPPPTIGGGGAGGIRSSSTPSSGRRPDSPHSDDRASSVSPQPHPSSSYHPPMLFPPHRGDSPGSPITGAGGMPIMSMGDLVDVRGGVSHHPHREQQSAADRDMLNRLNFRRAI